VPSQTPNLANDAILLRQLIGGDAAAAAEVLVRAGTSENPSLLVAAALLSADHTHLVRANERASTTRERQLVVLADAYLDGNADRFDVLIRDHLADHPDNLLASWIAGHSTGSTERTSA
jgi:hypothetical protein